VPNESVECRRHQEIPAWYFGEKKRLNTQAIANKQNETAGRIPQSNGAYATQPLQEVDVPATVSRENAVYVTATWSDAKLHISVHVVVESTLNKGSKNGIARNSCERRQRRAMSRIEER
jgi:hypothetical protein